MDLEEKIKEYGQFALLLEKSSFLDLKKQLQSIRTTNYAKYKRFYEYLFDLSLWGEVNKHKLSLAIFVAKQSKVIALPEDRTRIVLQLARLNGKSLDEINLALAEEFGDYFKMLPDCIAGNKKLTFKDITKRATEIRNGLRNMCYLAVENIVKEIMIYYKGNTINNKVKLLQVREATFSLMEKMRDALLFINPQSFAEVKPEIEEYYKITNRTQLDIKSLSENSDFDGIAKYVYIMAEIVSTKLRLIDKGLDSNDLLKAEKMIFDTLSGIEFNNRTSVEEMERIGMPLPRTK